MLMPGERIDLWADFSTLARQQVILRSLAFDPGGMGGGDGGGGGCMRGGCGGMNGQATTDGMHGGRGGGGCGGGGGGMGLANGTAFNILTVNVG